MSFTGFYLSFFILFSHWHHTGYSCFVCSGIACCAQDCSATKEICSCVVNQGCSHYCPRSGAPVENTLVENAAFKQRDNVTSSSPEGVIQDFLVPEKMHDLAAAGCSITGFGGCSIDCPLGNVAFCEKIGNNPASCYCVKSKCP